MPPYTLLTLPPAPSALLIVNLGAPLRVRAGTDIASADYADGCVVTMPTRAWEFGYPPRTRSVGVHFKPWGLAPFLPMPAVELCDRPVTIEQVWCRSATAELRDRLATADGPHEMLTLLEEELRRRLCEPAGLGLVRQASGVLAAIGGAVAIGDLSEAAGVGSTHLVQRFKDLIGVTPKRLARTYRFTATVFAIDPAGPVDWSDLAHDAGYVDQAHFGHEFRGLHRAHTDPARRSPAAVSPRTPRPRDGRLAAANRLISYKSYSPWAASLGASQSRGVPRGQGGHVRLGVVGRFRRGRE